jgi:hypothetical protein
MNEFDPNYYNRPGPYTPPAPTPRPKPRRRWALPVIAFGTGCTVLLVAALVAPNSATIVDDNGNSVIPAPTRKHTTAPKATTKPKEVAPVVGSTIPGDGTWVIGKDIKRGTYQTAGGDRCYWARLSGLSGELSDVITNNISNGPQMVTLGAGDVAFEASRCGTWTLVS